MDVRADRFPLVDSLRAIAALAIVGYHAAFYSGSLEGASASARIFTNLQVGVPIFFLVSGFLLYRPFTKTRLRGELPPLVGAYAWRRFLRIVPAYWVALTLAIVLGLAAGVTLANAPLFYGFGQIYSDSSYAGGLPQAWTLCVELSFYAFLPLWALAMRRLRAHGERSWLRQEVVALSILFAASVAYKVVLALSVDLNSFTSQRLLMPLPNFLDQFALGMGLAVASVWLERHRRSRVSRRLDELSWAPWALAAAAFAAVALVGPDGSVGGGLTRSEFLLRHLLWTACAAGIVFPAMLGDPSRGRVRALLSPRWLMFLGLISYGIFLQHVTVMKQLGEWGLDGGWAVWALLGGAGAIALGALSYYLVERPALSLKRLVPVRPAAAEGEALAEPAPLSPSAQAR